MKFWPIAFVCAVAFAVTVGSCYSLREANATRYKIVESIKRNNEDKLIQALIADAVKDGKLTNYEYDQIVYAEDEQNLRHYKEKLISEPKVKPVDEVVPSDSGDGFIKYDSP